jgi:hypothetical protein
VLLEVNLGLSNPNIKFLLVFLQEYAAMVQRKYREHAA